jgi:endonuclease/exonuclease/phosphatase family metal-dependent hydrolase
VLAACLVCVLSATSCTTTETPAASADGPAAGGRTSYSLLQMNLCLSGLADCLRYPEVVREAIAVIRDRAPNAVALNEVCRGDVARIAERTGYHRRFATVLYRGEPLPCRSPRGRGVFGNALLTRAAISSTAQRPFTAQAADPEQRRWICVVTTRRVTVCTTHLGARSEVRAATHRQCAELADVLAARASRGPTVAAGDVNRRCSCAPAGMWTRTDSRAAQTPGIQHAYGSAEHLRAPVARIVPAAFTDHDFLQVTARLVRR